MHGNTALEHTSLLVAYHLFYEREPKGDIATFELLPTCHKIKEDPKYLKDWRKNMEDLLKTAQENQNRSSEKMVLRHKNRHAPSEYETDDTVIVKITKSDKKLKVKKKHLSRAREKLFSDQGINIRLNMKLAKAPGMHGFLFQLLPLQREQKK